MTAHIIARPSLCRVRAAARRFPAVPVPDPLEIPQPDHAVNDMIGHAPRRDTLRTHRRWRVPDGVSLLELLCAVVVVCVLATASYAGVTSYNRSRRAARVAELVTWEITVARGYAVRSGRPMSLVIDERAMSVALRDGSSTRRKLSLGEGTPMQVDRIALDLAGDSLVFSPRGLCINCSALRPADLTVTAGGRVAIVRIGMFRHTETPLASRALPTESRTAHGGRPPR